MSAEIVLHPRAAEHALYAVTSQLKARGYDVPPIQSGRFYRAIPALVPERCAAVETPPAFDRRHSFTFWRPRA